MKISNTNVKQKAKTVSKHIQTYKYDDKLQEFVNDYNNRPHRSLNEIILKIIFNLNHFFTGEINFFTYHNMSDFVIICHCCDIYICPFLTFIYLFLYSM